MHDLSNQFLRFTNVDGTDCLLNCRVGLRDIQGLKDGGSTLTVLSSPEYGPQAPAVVFTVRESPREVLATMAAFSAWARQVRVAEEGDVMHMPAGVRRRQMPREVEMMGGDDEQPGKLPAPWDPFTPRGES